MTNECDLGTDSTNEPRTPRWPSGTAARQRARYANRPKPSQVSPNPLLNRLEAAAYCGLSATTIDRMRAAGEFPAPIQLTKRRVAWRRTDLEKWIDERAA